MYYAYAISLMYHLRAQEETYYLPIIERLQLNNKKQTRILNIIRTHQKSTVRFDKPTQDSIQDILAPALRAFLSQVVKEEFKTNPLSSQLYATSAVLFEQGIKRLILQNNQMIYQYIIPTFLIGIIDYWSNTSQVNQESSNKEAFIEGDFIKGSEIFRVEGMTKSMQDYVQTKWVELSLGIKNKLSQENNQKTIDEQVQAFVVDFFCSNNDENLNKYVQHLNTRFGVWGTDENLVKLHAALAGEEQNQLANGEFEVVQSQPMALSILKNGQVASDNHLVDSDIILNNISNGHWVSVIPEKYLGEKSHLPAIILGGLFGTTIACGIVQKALVVALVASLIGASSAFPPALLIFAGLIVLGALIGYLTSLAVHNKTNLSPTV
jgi:hypothetical protein